jgi:ribosomal protein S18 acetylase RimI-like enzyme
MRERRQETRDEPGNRTDDPAPVEAEHVVLPDGVEVRPARGQDASSYLAMWREVVAERRFVRTEKVKGTVRDYRRQFAEAVTNDRARLVAVARGRVIGALFIERMAHPVNRHVATLGMAVHAPWRGKGIGSALMAEAMRWARSAGVEKVTLEVYPTNEAAVALYRRFGFAEEGRLERQSRKSYGYEDELIMSRFLA